MTPFLIGWSEGRFTDLFRSEDLQITPHMSSLFSDQTTFDSEAKFS